MGGTKTIRKNFTSFRGRDLRSSDLIRDSNNAIDFRNLVVTKDSSIATRFGNKVVREDGEYLGLFNYAYSDRTSGAVAEEIISIADNLYKRRTNYFTVLYTGTGFAYLSLVLDPNSLTFKFVITENDNTVFNYDLGTGKEVSPVTLSALATAINGVASGLFSVGTSPWGLFPWGESAWGVEIISNFPAAFLPLTPSLTLTTGGGTLTYYDKVVINSPIANVFAAYFAGRGDTDFEHASFCNYHDTLLIAAGGYHFLQKYDGQNVYRVGIPEATTTLNPVNAGSGAVEAGDHSYIYFYKQVDNRGNIVEGVESLPETITLSGNAKVGLTIPSISATSGFNTGAAQVSGAQIAVTHIVVHAGHTFHIGDTAYYFDGISGGYVARTISGTTSTSITVSGESTTVADGAIISNNLRVVIARTVVGGADYYIIEELPNNPFSTTSLYLDNTADADLGAQYFFPLKDHNLLTDKPKYVITHQGLIVVGGMAEEPNTVKWSTSDSPESFPTATNSDDLPSSVGGVSGIFVNGDNLFAGKPTSIYVFTGTLDDSSFRVDKVNEGAIGIACHNATQDVGNGSIFLSNRGWWLMQGGGSLIEVGQPMNKIFYDPPTTASQTLVLKRSVAVFDPSTEEYLCFIPTESGIGTGRYVNTNALVYSFDVYNKSWGDYDGVNMGGGACISNQELFWQTKTLNASVAVVGNLYKKNNTGTQYDFIDHTSAITSKFGTPWEDGRSEGQNSISSTIGEPSMLKFSPRLRIYNLSTAVIVAPYTILVTTELNYVKGNTDTKLLYAFNAGNSLGGWGYFPWGSIWGSPRSVLPMPKKLKNTKFNALRFVFTHNAPNARMVITGWDFEMVACYRREMI